MRSLRLDYVAVTRASPLGAVVLIVGILSAAAALFDYHAVREELTTQDSRVADIRKSAKRGTVSATVNPRDMQTTMEEVKLAQSALQRLSVRWDDLFGALESARVNGVAMIAIEPDPAKNTVKLTAEAKSAEDMLNYVERLQTAPALADATLTSHEIRQNDPLQPLRFAVVASWIEQP